MKTVKVFAPAKINLTLHVTGQRPDGYHLLDSLVVFANIGDWVAVSVSDELRLQVTGPMADGVPDGGDNLIVQAARLAGVSGADIVLDKHLPMAAGIGGGSADAGAVLRAFQQSHDIELPDNGLSLGADVPVCLGAKTARMSGIGDVVVPVAGVPALAAVLVNPGIAVRTPDVFRALKRRDGAGMPDIPKFRDARACINWVRDQRNDLQEPAIRCAPQIGEVLMVLGQSGAFLTRMSGSGATCFGIFDTPDDADLAARSIRKKHPGWWVRPCVLAGSLQSE